MLIRAAREQQTRYNLTVFFLAFVEATRKVGLHVLVPGDAPAQLNQ